MSILSVMRSCLLCIRHTLLRETTIHVSFFRDKFTTGVISESRGDRLVIEHEIHLIKEIRNNLYTELYKGKSQSEFLHDMQFPVKPPLYNSE